MLTIITSSTNKILNRKPEDLFETGCGNIDIADKLNLMLDDIVDNDRTIYTLNRFVITRIGALINNRYIKSKNVKVIVITESGETEYSYNNSGVILDFPNSLYSPKVLRKKSFNI